MKASTFAMAALLSSATFASANEFEPAMQDYLDAEIMGWATNADIVAAIAAQNAQTMGYDQSQIDALDQAWRAEVGMGDTPTITPVITNAASDVLRELVEQSGGRVTEIFIMDMHGLNVAASDVTSDYWQGDEAKFQKTHGMGPDAVHFSEVELDESTQRYQGQISLTINDPATGKPIGAMTVGVDADSLM